MKKILFLIVILATMASNAQNPNWDWAKSAEGTTQQSIIASTKDNNGNIYYIGKFSQQITIDDITLNANTGNPTAYFLLKIDVNGTILFLKKIETHFYSSISSIAADNNNNIFVFGQVGDLGISGAGIPYTGSISFENGITLPFTSGDSFFVKIDLNGDALFGRVFPSNSLSNLSSIAFDNSNNIFLIGNYQGMLTVGGTTLNSTGNFDIYISKYDTAGNPVWAKGYGGANNDFVEYINFNSNNGNLSLLGNTTSPLIQFDTYNFTNNDNSNFILFKTELDSQGNTTTINNLGIFQIEPAGYGRTIKMTKENTIFQFGSFDTTSITFNDITLSKIGQTDIYLVKYNDNGTIAWAKNFGSNNGILTLDNLNTDTNGNLYLAADFSSSSITLNNTTFSNNGYCTTLILKLNPNGNIIWVKSALGTDNCNYPSTIDTHEGAFFVSGAYNSQNITFDNFNLLASPTTGSNNKIFFAKLQEGSLSLPNQEKDFITLYPNPVNTILNIKGNSEIIGKEYSIIDVFGRIINKDIINSETSSLETGNLKSGVYFIKNQNNLPIKFIKQ